MWEGKLGSIRNISKVPWLVGGEGDPSHLWMDAVMDAATVLDVFGIGCGLEGVRCDVIWCCFVLNPCVGA